MRKGPSSSSATRPRRVGLRIVGLSIVSLVIFTVILKYFVFVDSSEPTRKTQTSGGEEHELVTNARMTSQRARRNSEQGLKPVDGGDEPPQIKQKGDDRVKNAEDLKLSASIEKLMASFGKAIDDPQLFTTNQLSSSSFQRTDDLRLIASTGQRIFVAQTITQIHHGVYKVEALAADTVADGSDADGRAEEGIDANGDIKAMPVDNAFGEDKEPSPNKKGNTSSASSPPKVLRFAFKTECRPAAKWHGQQGWGEVAAHRLMQMLQQHSAMTTKHAEEEGEGEKKIVAVGDDNRAAAERNSFSHQFERAFDINGDMTTLSALRAAQDAWSYFGAEPFANTVAFAAGGILFITPDQLKTIVHRDQCGIMNEAEVKAWREAVRASDADLKRADAEFLKASSALSDSSDASPLPPSLRHFGLLPSPFHNYISRFDALSSASSPLASPSVPLYGVLLSWNANHNDDAIPKKDFLYHFGAPSKTSPGAQKGSKETARLLKEVSEIMTLDYVMGNEDREDKNWFTGSTVLGKIGAANDKRPQDGDAAQRLIMMDNGWVFTGRAYKESICGLYEALVLCPPLLRHLSGSGKCKVPPSHSKYVEASKLSSATGAGGGGEGGDLVAVHPHLRASSKVMEEFLSKAPYPMCRHSTALFTHMLRFAAAWIGEGEKGINKKAEKGEKADHDNDGGGESTTILSRIEVGLLPLNLGIESTREVLRSVIEELAVIVSSPSFLESLLSASASHQATARRGRAFPPDNANLASFWVRLVKNDLLIAHLQTAHAAKSTATFDMPLARHTGGQCVGEGGGSSSSATSSRTIELISVAIGKRMLRALRAAVDCIEVFGAENVMI